MKGTEKGIFLRGGAFMKRLCWVLCILSALEILGCADAGFAASSTSGCIEGNGRPKTVQRSVAPFHAVSIDGAFEVVLVFGKNTEVSVTAEDNLLANIVTVVSNGTLSIRASGSICATSPMKIRVGTARLEDVVSNGSNDIWLEQMAAQSLAVQIDGSGTVRGDGRADQLSVDIRGSAEFRSKELKAESVQIDISGSGDVEVFASKAIHADISGAGTVVYYGHPQQVTQQITGAGQLIPR
jgi:hypothetical protein